MLTTFLQWLSLAESHLYHGTVVDNEDSIRSMGLQPQVGHFVKTAYDEYEPDDLVFATDKKLLGKALTAMVDHIAAKLGKGFHDVTDLDIRNHGLLVKMPDASDYFQHNDSDEADPRSRSIEPWDYFSKDSVKDDRFQFIKGPGLVRLFHRYGVMPRTWPLLPNDPKRDKKLRGQYAARAIAQYGRGQKGQILQQAKGAKQSWINRQIDRSRREDDEE